MSTKPKPKPRVMWANYTTLASHPRCFCTASDCHGDNEWTEHARVAVRVAVIPLDDVPGIVERAAKAIYKDANCSDWTEQSKAVKDSARSLARTALTAAGIPCAKRRARK